MSIIDSFILMDRYSAWLKEINKDGLRAVDKELNECQRCGYCCALRPCIPTPDELEKIAEFLGMDVKRCVHTYFVLDKMNEGGTFIFPAKNEQKDITGRFVPWRRTYDKGYCIFFDGENHVCKIYPVRPQHAVLTECWSDKADGSTEVAVASWDGVDFRERYGVYIPDDEDDD